LNKDKIIEDSQFINLWKSEMIETLQKIDPLFSNEDIADTLDSTLKESMQIPKVTLDNNYTGETKDSNMLSVFDWVLERKPLIAGNATFYKNQSEAINPVAKMIDDFLATRKAIKKEMFKVEDKTSDLYKDLDRAQQNQKILANSYYGASGMPKSAFYSTWSGPATTGTAQSVISTTETLFEGFLVDNYKFIDINECFHYMNTIIGEDYKLPKFIKHKSVDETLCRLRGMFFEDDYLDDFDEIISKYLSSLSKTEVTKIYYKNNIVEFTRNHYEILTLYDEIFSSVKNYEYAKTVDDIPVELLSKFSSGDDTKRVKDYNNFVNNQFFMDPNSPPDTIKETLERLNSYYMDCVYVPFLSIDRIHRLKYFPRKTVCIVDTDSNILALDAWVNFCRKEVLHGHYGRSDENNKFIIINAMAYFITSAVRNILDLYGLNSYIPDGYRSKFNMKNEFYFDKLVIGKKKKRYISSIKLREGNLLDPYKPDVKGFEFMKATTSEHAKKRFDNIVRNHILESDIPNTSGILKDLRDFDNEIRNSILCGDTTYLPLGNAKDLSAYKKPYSQQGVRGAIAWNIIYPDRAISFPSKVSLLKLNIFTLDNIEDLQNTDPRIYNIIRNEIFGCKIKDIADKGLQVLAIPGNESIPEWCQPYIDYNTVINNIVGQFKGVLEVFGIDCPEVGKTIKSVNRKTKKFSNIVRF
jgi:hypothetical protein